MTEYQQYEEVYKIIKQENRKLVHEIKRESRLIPKNNLILDQIDETEEEHLKIRL